MASSSPARRRRMSVRSSCVIISSTTGALDTTNGAVRQLAPWPRSSRHATLERNACNVRRAATNPSGVFSIRSELHERANIPRYRLRPQPVVRFVYALRDAPKITLLDRLLHFRKIHRKTALAKRDLAVVASEKVVDVVPPHDFPMLRLDAPDLCSEPICVLLYRVLDKHVRVALIVSTRCGEALVIAHPSSVVVVREQVVRLAGHAASR